MTQLDSINAKGLYVGWHAEQLRDKAKRMGISMSIKFQADLGTTTAFSVPARAIKVTPQWITYEFLDGSILRLRNTQVDRNK